MASLTKLSISYSDLQKNIDEQSLSNVLDDITGMETPEQRATDFINSTFWEIQTIAIKVDFNLADFEDATGAILNSLKHAYILLTLGTILNSGTRKLGWDFKKEGKKILEGLWGIGVYSGKETPEQSFFDVVETPYTPVGKMKDLYDNDLFS